MKKAFLLLLMSPVLGFLSCNKSDLPPYLNTKLPVEERVNDLVGRMTLEEKASQLVYDAPAIDRLGIPAYNWWNECLHGVARAGKATVFPQAIGMAATWDRSMLHSMADVTSTEARAKYHDFISKGKRGIYQGLTFWSPNINIFRDPRWGRGMETYGEDPCLTGELASMFIQGLQGDDPHYFKTIATAKHYVVHSGPEPLRHSFDAVISDRDFRDTYFPAFRQSILEGKAYSVMCAYNRYMGEPCCGSDELLNGILRNELGFDGYIVSDCGAIYDFYYGHHVVDSETAAAALGLQSGTDLNCGDIYTKIVDAVNQGLLSEEDVNLAVTRLFTARMKLGMFDPDEKVPYTHIAYDTVACTTHKALAAEMARESMVLLKNENGLLPLSPDIKKIAVIGPNADDTEVMFGNYNGTPTSPVTPLEGIRRLTEGSAEVRYALGSSHTEGLPYFVTVHSDMLYTDKGMKEHGLTARYFDGYDCSGEPLKEQTEAVLDRYWWDDEALKGMVNDSFSVEWSGILVPPVSGHYALGCEAKFFNLYVDGEQVAVKGSIHHPNKVYHEMELKAGKPYHIRVTTQDRHGDALCRLIWAVPDPNRLEEALETAGWADVVIMVMGLSPRLEGEEMPVHVAGFDGGDRLTLDLPAVQEELIRKLSELNKPLVLVLMNGSPLSVNWEQAHIPAILEAWYPGEAGGTAIADVLFGRYNPAGRLPVTFYRSVDDLPPFEDYAMAGRTYRYFTGDVLYPFGYGLSYSTFSYSNLELSNNRIPSGKTVRISVDVSNTGDLDGDEVVQFYLKKEDPDFPRPDIELFGFERTRIRAGETKKVSVDLTPADLERYDEVTGSYRIEKGRYTLYAGPSADKKVLQAVELEVQ